MYFILVAQNGTFAVEKWSTCFGLVTKFYCTFYLRFPLLQLIEEGNLHTEFAGKRNIDSQFEFVSCFCSVR